jgi:hypothetical protein
VWKRASDGNIVGKSGAELGDDDNSVSERSGGGRLDMVAAVRTLNKQR